MRFRTLSKSKLPSVPLQVKFEPVHFHKQWPPFNEADVLWVFVLPSGARPRFTFWKVCMTFKLYNP